MASILVDNNSSKQTPPPKKKIKKQNLKHHWNHALFAASHIQKRQEQK